MSVEVSCQRCNRDFETKKSDTKWCPDCRIIAKREGERNFWERTKHPCLVCGIAICKKARLCVTCENKRRTREHHPSWKGGRYLSKGYVFVACQSGTPGKGKGAFYQREHIVVWEQTYGKPLPKGWVVHHLNGVRDDNRPENLLAISRREHHNLGVLATFYRQRIRALEQQLQELHQRRLFQ